ncbi:MAG TPA: cytochrome b/b6 domain-containing protein [Armatimonadota bacterium]|jgi:thiosulfate reductase cytochrome b subunit
MMTTRPMFPGWVRGWHWMNAALFVTLAVTGFSLHFAGAGAAPVSFRLAVLTHNLAGALLALNYFVYVAILIFTGEWRQYAVRLHGIVGRLRVQAAYYLGGIARGEPHPFHATPERRFNPLQQLTYAATMFVGFPVLAITGLFMLFPETAPERVAGIGGVWPMAVLHTLLAYCFVAFLAMHVYLALTCSEPHSGLRAMITGGAIAEPNVGPTRVPEIDNHVLETD